jgi:hypothetical protein
MREFFLFVLGLFFITQNSMAQDKVTLLNGLEYEGLIADTSFLNISINRKKSSRPFVLDRYRVFSINWNGTETVLYRKDSAAGNIKTEQEMRLFIKGEQDGNSTYKAPWLVVGGFAAGFFGGYVQPLMSQQLGKPYLDKGEANPYGWMEQLYAIPIVPLSYIIFSGSRWIKIDKNKISNKIYLSEDSYLEGYERVARSKKVQRALWSSIGGLVAGLVVTYSTAK